MRRWYPVFFMVICAGCHSVTISEGDKTSISLSRDSQQVCVNGLDYSVLLELKNDLLSQDDFQKILAVYRMPGDTDMKDEQNEQPGTYRVTNNQIIFKPDTTFKKHQVYFARFYGHSTNNSAFAMAQNKGNLKAPHFTEAVFKF